MASSESAPEAVVDKIEAAKPETASPAPAALEKPASIAASFAARSRPSRVTILAIAIALSAAAGSTVGAMAAALFAKPQQSIPDDGRSIEVNALRGVITQLSSEVAALKAAIDGNAKSAQAQMTKLADRVERSERAQAEPAARVAKLSELLERIDRRVASNPAAAPETTGSVAPKQQDRPPVLSEWVLRDVFEGRAMVENDRFGVFEVVPGSRLPGVGRIETIRRQDGRWVVVTAKGVIGPLR